jgi:hypothetical protein
MRLSYLLMLVAATILSSGDAASIATTPGNAHQLGTVDGNSSSRFLRGFRTTAADEERTLNVNSLLKLLKLKKATASAAATDDFAKATLDKMLASPAFKREMFEKWSTYKTEKILKTLDLNKRDYIPYASMLQEFLNAYRRTTS